DNEDDDSEGNSSDATTENGDFDTVVPTATGRIDAALHGALLQSRKGSGRRRVSLSTNFLNDSELNTKKDLSTMSRSDHALMLKSLVGDPLQSNVQGDEDSPMKRGIWNHKVVDEKPLNMIERDRYWIINIERPHGVEEKQGEGMLLWFSEESEIFWKNSGGKKESNDAPFVSFYSFDRKKNIGGELKKHGDQLGYLEGRRLYGDISKSALSAGSDTHEELKVADEEDFQGVIGDGLPGKGDAVFVPAMTCVVKFHSPGGTGSNFTICACYCSESPLLMEDSEISRKFHWGSTVLSFALTLQICFSDNIEIGFILWFLVALLEAIATALERTEEASNDSEHSKMDLFDRKGYELIFRRLCRKRIKLRYISESHLERVKSNVEDNAAAQMIHNDDSEELQCERN
ncbi:MAG: hypothetical protein VXZ58_09680, partial [Actinomycetota bacterium]|nr:hypothetical protein [Actinomycetota bacterium]